MAYNAMDYQKMVEDFVKTPEGRKYLKEQHEVNVGYSKIEIKAIAERLKKDIITCFGMLTDDPISAIQNPAWNHVVIVEANKKADLNKGLNTLRIKFKPESLMRYSLWNWHDDNKMHAGPQMGVYDIIGLFTQGYSASAFAYGDWMMRESSGGFTEANERPDGGFIKSKITRSGDDFINQIMRDYQAAYPDIEFRWPSLWGGTY